MNIVLFTLTALIVSLLCLLYLRKSDPKRRRVYRLGVWDKKRYESTAWILCFLPGFTLLFIAEYSAFILWFAALSLLGWAVAIKKPTLQ